MVIKPVYIDKMIDDDYMIPNEGFVKKFFCYTNLKKVKDIEFHIFLTNSRYNHIAQNVVFIK